MNATASQLIYMAWTAAVLTHWFQQARRTPRCGVSNDNDKQSLRFIALGSDMDMSLRKTLGLAELAVQRVNHFVLLLKCNDSLCPPWLILTTPCSEHNLKRVSHFANKRCLLSNVLPRFCNGLRQRHYFFVIILLKDRHLLLPKADTRPSTRQPQPPAASLSAHPT